MMPVSRLICLSRIAWRKKPRNDWAERWNAAGDSVHWKGALRYGYLKEFPMSAAANSPIWAALAAGRGGFRDACGSGEPPFAFGSGLGWIDLPMPNSREERKRYRSLFANAAEAARDYLMEGAA